MMTWFPKCFAVRDWLVGCFLLLFFLCVFLWGKVAVYTDCMYSTSIISACGLDPYVVISWRLVARRLTDMRESPKRVSLENLFSVPS